MRLLYALDTYRPNIDGVAISSERIAKGLARRGHAVGIIAPGRRLADYEEDVDGLPVYRVRSMRVLSDRWRLPVMAGDVVERAIASFRPDVVVVSLPFLLSRAAVGAARRLGVPVVGVTGTMPEWLTANLPLPRGIADRANPAIWKLIADYYDRCEVVVGVSATALRLLQDHGLKRSGVVISNGVSLRRFRPRNRREDLAGRLGVDARPTVLYAGRLDAEKRMDLWLEGAALVRQLGVDAQFVVVGDGSEVKHLAKAAARLELGDNLKLVGFLNDEDYADVYSLADVFAITSPAELQSIVTLEAAASGLPIVGVDAGALPELVKAGYNGYTFADGDTQAMAAAVATLLTDPSMARQMGRRSRMTAMEHDIDRTIDRYERLFRALESRFRARRGPGHATRPPGSLAGIRGA